jgi:hypothetical protein
VRYPLVQLVVALTVSASAVAAPSSIEVVNGTGAPLSNLEIRPVGKGWSAMTPGLSPGARTMADLAGDDCAFDVRGTVAGGVTVQWSRLNLCEVKAVTLNRRADGTSWADYD